MDSASLVDFDVTAMACDEVHIVPNRVVRPKYNIRPLSNMPGKVLFTFHVPELTLPLESDSVEIQFHMPNNFFTMKIVGMMQYSLSLSLPWRLTLYSKSAELYVNGSEKILVMMGEVKDDDHTIAEVSSDAMDTDSDTSAMPSVYHKTFTPGISHAMFVTCANCYSEDGRLLPDFICMQDSKKIVFSFENDQPIIHDSVVCVVHENDMSVKFAIKNSKGWLKLYSFVLKISRSKAFEKEHVIEATHQKVVVTLQKNDSWDVNDLVCQVGPSDNRLAFCILEKFTLPYQADHDKLSALTFASDPTFNIKRTLPQTIARPEQVPFNTTPHARSDPSQLGFSQGMGKVATKRGILKKSVSKSDTESSDDFGSSIATSWREDRKSLDAEINQQHKTVHFNNQIARAIFKTTSAPNQMKTKVRKNKKKTRNAGPYSRSSGSNEKSKDLVIKSESDAATMSSDVSESGDQKKITRKDIPSNQNYGNLLDGKEKSSCQEDTSIEDVFTPAAKGASIAWANKLLHKRENGDDKNDARRGKKNNRYRKTMNKRYRKWSGGSEGTNSESEVMMVNGNMEEEECRKICASMNDFHFEMSFK